MKWADINKGILFFIISCLIFPSCNVSAQESNVPVAVFSEAIAKGNVQLLDVRTAGEYQSGHLNNALQANWNNEEEFAKRVASLDKSKPVYTYCLSGVRSGDATQWLRSKGFTAYNLQGGINAWRKAGNPVIEEKKVPQMSMQDYLAKVQAGKTVLVDFGASWCPPCKKMTPVVDSIAGVYAGTALLIKIDGGEQFELCKQLAVDEFPTFIIYKNGKEAWRKSGIVDPAILVTGLQ